MPSTLAADKQHAVEVHDRQAPEFDARYKELARDPYSSTFTYGRMKIEAMLAAEMATLAPGSKILDVGCGTGFNMVRLRDQGFDVSGVEPAESMRRRALDQKLNVIDGDSEQLPFADGTFDAVISVEVIRYLADPLKSIREMCRVLKPGGTAFITAAPALALNGYALINQVTARLPIPSFTKVKHTFVTEGSALRLMNDAGFAHAEVHGAFIGPWHVVARVAPSLVGQILRAAEKADDMVCDLPGVRNLANHMVLTGRR